MRRPLLGLCEPDSVYTHGPTTNRSADIRSHCKEDPARLTLAEIIDRVEFPQKGIPDDPERPDGRGNVHPGKGRDARPTRVQNVLATLERVLLVVEGQREIGERVDGGTVDGVLTVPRFSRADPAKRERRTQV